MGLLEKLQVIVIKILMVSAKVRQLLTAHVYVLVVQLLFASAVLVEVREELLAISCPPHSRAVSGLQQNRWKERHSMKVKSARKTINP